MKKNNLIWVCIIALFASLSFSSCSKDDELGSDSNVVDLTGVEETEDGFFDGTLYYKITSNVASNREACVAKCVDTAVTVEIPSGVKIKGEVYKLTSIGEKAFSKNTKLQRVSMPNTLKSIGVLSFYGCPSLQSVIIPNSVDDLGKKTFYNCKNLTSVTIGNSVKRIGELTFSGCQALTSVTIPNSVTSIGEEAFKNCTSLVTIAIPNSVTSLERQSFSECIYEA